RLVCGSVRVLLPDLSPCTQKTPGYCCPTSFRVLRVLYLGEVSPAFLPSKKACGTHISALLNSPTVPSPAIPPQHRRGPPPETAHRERASLGSHALVTSGRPAR